MKKEEFGMKLVDMDTGQVFENVVKLTTHKQDEGLKKKRLMSEKNKEFVDEYGNFFFKTISKRTTKLDDKLKDSDIVRILYTATYLDYENDLRMDCGKRVSKSVLKELIGAQDRIFYNWYNDAVAKKIIKEDSEGYLSMNANYCIKGEINRNKDYNRIFIDSIRHIYDSNKSKNMKAIGNVLKILPYVNKKHCIVCWNPNEVDADLVEPISLSDLVNIIGDYKGNLTNFKNTVLKYTLQDGLSMALFINSNNVKDAMLFNPILVYSGRNDDMPDCYDLFRILGRKIKNIDQNGIKVLQLLDY